MELLVTELYNHESCHVENTTGCLGYDQIKRQQSDSFCGLAVMRIVICITDSKEMDSKRLVQNQKEIDQDPDGEMGLSKPLVDS